MKIIKIEENTNIYTVYFEPTKFEKLFGIKPKQIKYKDTGYIFKYGSGSVYCQEDGTQLFNGSFIGEAIDKWKRSF